MTKITYIGIISKNKPLLSGGRLKVMKSKEQSSLCISRPIKILFAVLISFFIFSSIFCTIGFSASAKDFTVENHNKINEYASLLSKEIENYSLLDTSEGKSVSKNVTSAINTYSKELVDLKSHEDINARNLTAEAELSYEKGRAAGAIAWIFHNNLLYINDEGAISRLSASYNVFLSQVYEGTDAGVVRASANVMRANLNRSIYKEKIQLLKQADDSIASSGIIEKAYRNADTISDSELFAPTFTALYDSLSEELYLQRSRDSLSEDFEALFKIICPKENFASHGTAVMFGYNLKNSDSIEKMNTAMAEALAEILKSDAANVYVSLFFKELCGKIEKLSVQASADNTLIDVSSAFQNYAFNSAKAETKDIILEIINPESNTELIKIEQEFNGADALVDKCIDTKGLEIEVTRAEYRKSLYLTKADALKKTEIILGEHDKSSFFDKIEEAYTDNDQKLVALLGTQAGFEGLCKDLADTAKKAISDVIDEAKVDRFLKDHKSVLTKPYEELIAGDEILLKNAISDFGALEEKIQKALDIQLNSLVEKYKSVLLVKIKSLLPGDNLYLDLCDGLCEELKNIDAEDIGVFYNKCNYVVQKAEIFYNIFTQFRQITSSAQYKEYTNSEQDELLGAVEDSAENLSEISLELFESEFKSAILTIETSKKTLINQIFECARVRISARNSSTAIIQAILAESQEKIKSSSDKNEMQSIADAAIFKINRELTKEEIIKRLDKQEHLIKEMKFISKDDVSSLVIKINSLKANAVNDASASENITVLSFIWDSFNEDLAKIKSDAEKKDLENAKASYLEEIEKDVKSFSEKLRERIYLSSQSCDVFLNSFEEIANQFKKDLVSCQSSGDVSNLYSTSLENLNIKLKSADEENLLNYKEILISSLEEIKSMQDDYSDENYNKLLEQIELGKKNITSADSLSGSKEAYENSSLAIESINTLIEDAKENAKLLLDNWLNQCRKTPSLYSEANLLLIEEIYQKAIEELSTYNTKEDCAAVAEFAQKTLEEMKAIPRDTLYTAGAENAFVGEGIQYPQNYNFANGYWASVYSSNNIPSDAVLTIKDLESSSLKEIQKLVRNAAKKNNISSSTSLSKEQIKALKSCSIAKAIEINLSNLTSQNGKYTIKMLIPDSLAKENILGIVFVGENNIVEFYNCKTDNSFLSFDLTHFSKYYIVTENTTNLYPLIIFLIIVLIFELFLFVFVLLLRMNRKRKEQEDGMYSLLSGFNIIGMPIALKVQPQRGVTVAIILSAAIIALGCGIAFLAKIELDALKKSKRLKSESKEKIADFPEKLLSEKESVACLCTAKTEFLKEGTRTCEDEDFCECITEAETVRDDEEEIRSFRKAELNLDEIAEQFDAGDFVNLELLKKKRLVSRRTDYVKILARGSLTKPLIIEAQDFSRTAEEMLTSIGGEAIRVPISRGKD